MRANGGQSIHATGFSIPARASPVSIAASPRALARPVEPTLTPAAGIPALMKMAPNAGLAETLRIPSSQKRRLRGVLTSANLSAKTHRQPPPHAAGSSVPRLTGVYLRPIGPRIGTSVWS